jgi:hypothetical protein
MSALSQKVQSQTLVLLLAGIVMVVTLWFSKKARTVTETEISLGHQDETTERFESIWLSRTIVRMVDSFFKTVTSAVPQNLRRSVRRRMDPHRAERVAFQGPKPSFDLVRASVNLMVASAVVSFATSMKLPLSTTYVTFMVAMGTSFSDQAWGRETAVYRVTGVLTVIGGWFMTALIAFVVAFAFASAIHYFKVPGVFGIMLLAGLVIWNNQRKHKGREKEKEEERVFNLKKINDAHMAISSTFDHLAHLLGAVRESFDLTFDALFEQNVDELRKQRKKVKQIQLWTNIIMANIFKVLRLQNRRMRKYRTSTPRPSDGCRKYPTVTAIS